MVTSFFFIMSAITFSWLGFPISTMPQWLQYLTYATPAQFLMDFLWPQMLAMFGLGLLTVAMLRFHKALD